MRIRLTAVGIVVLWGLLLITSAAHATTSCGAYKIQGQGYTVTGTVTVLHGRVSCSTARKIGLEDASGRTITYRGWKCTQNTGSVSQCWKGGGWMGVGGRTVLDSPNVLVVTVHLRVPHT
jgi:hypothetical protein